MSTKGVFGLTGRALEKLQVALVVAPAFILFGYNQAGLGGLLTEPDWVKTFPEINTISGPNKSYHSTIQGVVVATFVIGALFGALSCSYTGDKFGRRAVVLAGGICTLVGEILECSAFQLAQLIVGRIIIGLGIGQLSATVPVWQSETSGAKNRGKQVIVCGIFMCLGYTLESWIDLGFFELEGPVTWRAPIAIAIAFSLILIASVFLFPESPRWLVRQGRIDEARSAITVLRGYSDENAMELQAELTGIELSLEESNGASLKDMLSMGEDKLLYRFCLCIMLQFYQQMSGSNLISVYTTILFQQNLGMSGELSRVLSAGALTWKFLSSFIAFVCIDRFGRRAVFIYSGIGMCICMICLAICTSMEQHSAQIAAAFFIYLYNFFVPVGFLGGNFLYCTEVAPIRLRVAMSSISTANHWLWNFVVVMVTPIALNTIGWKYYFVYAAVAFCIPISVYFLFPETMGRNLEEIDMMFRESPSVLATPRFAKTRPIAMPQEYVNEKSGVEHHGSDLEK
ncbi:Sugar transporter [Lasiodiplodia theobromae]|uniref:Sugar transporter STL1 n=1 Tax=Lasiodiplodia theobromae TaxID=45133 RepID=A0A5N5DFT4_9PEZI|nr:Sugar transporter [Lasiodiplodia theobromae]KAB2576360.1 Sugar transporter STL1 [Lasiodiplodia theobromae]KAF4544060.1 Sugar transporter [Lasiodiplodia theobromae]